MCVICVVVFSRETKIQEKRTVDQDGIWGENPNERSGLKLVLEATEIRSPGAYEIFAF